MAPNYPERDDRLPLAEEESQIRRMRSKIDVLEAEALRTGQHREKRFRAVWDSGVRKLTIEDQFSTGAIRELCRHVVDRGMPDRLEGRFADEPWPEDVKDTAPDPG